MKRYILALDQGTTSSRAILFDRNANIIGIERKKITQIYPKPAWVEHDPLEIWETQIAVAKEVIKTTKVKLEEIAAIGITNQRETTIVWDRETGKPIYNAIVWQCRRTAQFCNSLKKSNIAPYIMKNTGLVIDAYFSATKLNWLLNSSNIIKQNAIKGKLAFGTVDSWLLWNLTGGKVHATDYTNASRTMIFNINSLSWDEKLIKELQIPVKMLPEVYPSSHFYGTTTPELFDGVKIPITGIAGDQQASLFGHGCFKKGDTKVTYGTGTFVLMNIGEKPAISRNRLINTIAWGTGKSVIYALEGSIFNTGSAIQWLEENMNINIDKEQIAEDSGGVFVVPAFTGLGAPYWDMDARGLIIGLSRDTKKEQVIRAFLESIAYRVKDIVEAIKDETNFHPEKLRVDGRGSTNNILMQIQADIAGIPVIAVGQPETTALGAAFLAGLQVSFWKSLDELSSIITQRKTFQPRKPHHVIEGKYRKWKKAVERAKGWK